MSIIDAEKPYPTMISIRNLHNCKFEIPVFQRGFRWTKQQIKELLDDLYAFSETDQSTYCLQNVTIRKKLGENGEEIYEVIDGQQRLTAIWLLVMSYIDSEEYHGEPMPIYSLVYEEKEHLTEYVENVTRETKMNPSSSKLLNISHPKDIDSSFIYDAFEYILNDYKNSDKPYFEILKAIFNDEFQSEKKQISVIWNEISAVGSDDIEKTKYVINRFSNLNANKIPLTESELIKAYFIDKLSDRVQEFALQWEEIERGLNNEEFWCFLSSGKDEETRADLLFWIHLNKEETADTIGQHSLSRLIRAKLTDKEAAYKEWMQIVQLYDTLNDWYNDYFYYHIIGLIIAVEGKVSTTVIKELYDEYNKSSKKEFRELLKKRIRKENCYRIPFLTGENGDWNIEAPSEILFEDRDNKEISYTKNKGLIKPILLLFNISLLLNAYSINSENAAERFSFKIYKSKTNPIEIEHINPKHLEGKKNDGSNYTSSEKKDWALSTIEIIENDDEKKNLSEDIEKANWNNPNKLLIEKIENAAQLNALNNLTMLDKNLNIRYGDNFFNKKRNHVLAARFGNPIPDKNTDVYYEQSVIFPGTMWIFMRQYNESTNHEQNRWDANDRREYIDCMQKSIYKFLKPMELNKTKNREGE